MPMGEAAESVPGLEELLSADGWPVASSLPLSPEDPAHDDQETRDAPAPIGHEFGAAALPLDMSCGGEGIELVGHALDEPAGVGQGSRHGR
jgi:hypothetical protein